jgi:hypothetical protein
MGRRANNTGHALNAEFGNVLADLAQRAQEREQVVVDRLAVLEDEHSVLGALKSKLALLRGE